MDVIVQVQNLDLEAPTRLQEFEVWWKTHHARWPEAPEGHFIGPDGRLLTPVEFAAYAADPRRLIFIFSEPQHHPVWGRA